MSPEICVIAKRDATPSRFRRVYVGRPTALGNPYPLRHESQRLVVIDRYTDWLSVQLSEPQSDASRMFAGLLNILMAGENLALECYCSPLSCHADVIARKLKLALWAQRGTG